MFQYTNEQLTNSFNKIKYEFLTKNNLILQTLP